MNVFSIHVGLYCLSSFHWSVWLCLHCRYLVSRCAQLTELSVDLNEAVDVETLQAISTHCRQLHLLRLYSVNDQGLYCVFTGILEENKTIHVKIWLSYTLRRIIVSCELFYLLTNYDARLVMCENMKWKLWRFSVKVIYRCSTTMPRKFDVLKTQNCSSVTYLRTAWKAFRELSSDLDEG